MSVRDNLEEVEMPHVTFIHGTANKLPRERLQTWLPRAHRGYPP